MSKAIYQKYRSQKFSEILGHDLIKKVLLNSLKTESLSHAILFAGPRGTGKTSMARLLAKALNCKNPEKNGDCCGKCSVCKQVEMGSYIDLIEIDAASNRGIEEIRILKEKVNFAPAEGKYKIYIIDEVHMLTKEAFNALLKTLEEPPEFIVFVLATTEPHKIPLTILSRVQRFDLKLASEGELLEKLQKIAKSEGVKISREAVLKIFELSGGSFRDSESLFSKLLNFEIKKDKEISLDDVEKSFGLINKASIKKFAGFLIAGDSNSAIKFSQDLIKDGFSVDQLIFQTIQHFRGLIREVMEGNSKVSLARIVQILSKFSSAGAELRDAQIITLPLEIAILELGNVKMDAEQKEERKDVQEDVQKVEEYTKPVETIAREAKKESVQKGSKKDDISKLSFEALNQDWNLLVEATRKHNHHLYAFLSKAELDSIQNDTILLKVPYKFHKQKIESVSTREILAKIFQDKYGIKVIVKCEIDPALIEKIEKEEEMDDSNENIVEEVFSDL
ncbi:DNA polymerase III subunit gamma/tau [Candidatus Dojkabacteria bacterium]|nr:DNA polymerase III subunit gamma/tau [Candidatus Dojkabacteria bacterium]